MRRFTHITLLCAALLGCDKSSDKVTPECPEKRCAHRAYDYGNGKPVGEDCYNKALPCKKFCLKHDYQNVD